jgi:endo-1,3(4)-beta-glucanase
VQDFFDGHSWASGLFVQNNGKSQESSSEAINAYYGR